MKRGWRFKQCAVLGLLGWSALPGQISPQKFEVAAIRPDRQGGEDETIDRVDGGRLSVTNASLRTLILNAYNVLTFQIAGGPNWLDSERYNIEAKTGRPEKPSRDELKPLLQNLLNDRFRLRVLVS